jgi:hypothetical protein
MIVNVRKEVGDELHMPSMDGIYCTRFRIDACHYEGGKTIIDEWTILDLSVGCNQLQEDPSNYS